MRFSALAAAACAGLSFLSDLAGASAGASDGPPPRPPCLDASEENPQQGCDVPIHELVTITPGSAYAAKFVCTSCPWLDEDSSVHMTYNLFLHLTLSADNRTVLLNGHPFFPSLPTTPTPPQLALPQVRDTFSYTNLSKALTCPDPSSCPYPIRSDIYECIEWCQIITLQKLPLDYIYTTVSAKWNDDKDDSNTRYWSFQVDPIGAIVQHTDSGEPKIDDAFGSMLRVTIEGTEVNSAIPPSEKDKQDGGSLFSAPNHERPIYDLKIVDAQIISRDKEPVPNAPLTIWQRISRFFGADVWESPSKLIFIRDDWDVFGKKGSFRNMLGYFIHWDYWDLFWIILTSTCACLIALYGFYRLFFWIQKERELMKWRGMDDVWDKLRREREEEENALLSGRYRDEPEEAGPSVPTIDTDDIDTMKPLPIKPLPEKPLPDVPLIDAQ